MKQSFTLGETEHARYLMIPEFEASGTVHFFGLKASYPRYSGDPPLFNGARVVTAKQVHRDQVLLVSDEMRDQARIREIGLAENDALVTQEKGFFVGIYTADCVPILLADPDRGVVAAIHAGWRGSLMRVAAKTVHEMTGKLGCRPENVIAALGPCIGPCCYEVGKAVLEPLKQLYPRKNGVVHLKENGKGMLDLLELNRRQLVEAGLRDENLYAVGLCTSCRPDLFSSYRRDGKVTAGMLSGIMQV